MADEHPSVRVHTITGWKESDVTESGGWEKYLVKRTKISGWRNPEGVNAMLLIREAQETYWDRELWDDFLKNIRGGAGPYVILFSRHGSPGAEPVEHYPKAPLRLHLSQRLSLRGSPFSCDYGPGVPTVGLLLNQDETTDMLDRAANFPIWARFDAGLKSLIYRVTSGHLGAIASLACIISNFCGVSI